MSRRARQRQQAQHAQHPVENEELLAQCEAQAAAVAEALLR